MRGYCACLPMCFKLEMVWPGHRNITINCSWPIYTRLWKIIVRVWSCAQNLKFSINSSWSYQVYFLLHVQIRMLDMVLKQSQEDCMEPQTARILLYKLFYDQTDQGMTQFILNLIKSFDTHKQAKRFLTHFYRL